jgi:hypothetical protein
MSDLKASRRGSRIMKGSGTKNRRRRDEKQ